MSAHSSGEETGERNVLPDRMSVAASVPHHAQSGDQPITSNETLAGRVTAAHDEHAHADSDEEDGESEDSGAVSEISRSSDSSEDTASARVSHLPHLGQLRSVANASAATTSTSSPSHSNALSRTLHLNITANITVDSDGVISLVPNPSAHATLAGNDQPSNDRLRITDTPASLSQEGISQQTTDTSSEARPREGSNDQRRQEVENEEGDEDTSSDSEEEPHWASFKDDNSRPNAEELAKIEEVEKTSKPAATDFDAWELYAFDDLDDPEHVPYDDGCILWTVKGVHGTPEKPNTVTYFESTATKIGGYDWHVKFYPRGRDGTDYTSVFIACEPSEESTSHASSQTLTDDDSIKMAMSSIIPSEGSTKPVEAATDDANDTREYEGTPPNKDVLWNVAAQVCCVMYNPDEPRVYVSQKSCHGFNKDNTDWGWTRFHGPWESLHIRGENQRRALLQKDQLCFAIHIRTVRDETRSLWWHPSENEPTWNHFKMTGVPAFSCWHWQRNSSSFIAALASWYHLKPFLDIIRSYDDKNTEGSAYFAPPLILYDLWYLVENKYDADDESPFMRVGGILRALADCIVEQLGHKDVIALWEDIRQVMTVEMDDRKAKTPCSERLSEFWDKVWILKQPDHFALSSVSDRYQPQNQPSTPPNLKKEPQSVQEAIDLAAQHSERAFRLDKRCRAAPGPPDMLHIELYRQHFDQQRRQFRKSTHRIAIDEQIEFLGTVYAIYGIIVHAGPLESRNFETIVRPGGPGTKWIRYAGDSDERKVSTVTRKQALTAHEGRGRLHENNDEEAAVAYIAMYVKEAQILNLLEIPFKTPMAKMSSPIEVEGHGDPSKTMRVFFISETNYHAPHEHFLDRTKSLWIQREQRPIYSILLPGSTTFGVFVAFLRQILARSYGAQTADSLCLWYLRGGKDMRSEPAGFRNRALDDPLAHLMGPDTGELSFIIATAAPEITDFLMSNLEHYDESELNEAFVRESADIESSRYAARESDGGERQIPFRETHLQQNRTEDDTIMANSQDAGEESSRPSALTAFDSLQLWKRLASSQMLCYICFFNWETQRIYEIKAIHTHLEAKVYEEVIKAILDECEALGALTLMKIDNSLDFGNWEIYINPGFKHERLASVAKSATFSDIAAGRYHPEPSPVNVPLLPDNSKRFIVQRRLSKEEEVKMSASGEAASVPEFFNYLYAKVYEPMLAESACTQSYFGSQYYSGQQQLARPHGRGVLVTLSGDKYSGPFASGKKSSHIDPNTLSKLTPETAPWNELTPSETSRPVIPTGEMIYANNDTYIGQWCDDQPHGQGSMTYAATGNTYMGGWKHGRRHGRGTMQYQVADEEQKLCQICYEEEMDALFYACGHVCACQTCACKVNICPVCREKVRAVVKVRWTV